MGIHTAYTIHNLAMQGIRPFKGDASSLQKWFPQLRYDQAKLVDPRFSDCVNPMRAGVLLADKVNTVSPTYASEILLSSNHDKGIYGGEGLEQDLQCRASAGSLLGIVNGCEYPTAGVSYKAMSRAKLGELMLNSVEVWGAKQRQLASAHWLVEKRIAHWLARKTVGFTMTSVGRVTEQKVRLLLAPMADGRAAIDHVLESLGGAGAFIMLGSGGCLIGKRTYSN